MGDLKAHLLFDVWMFGVSYGEFEYVHRAMDHPWVEMFGTEHRRLMHDEKSIMWIESRYGVMAGVIARGHRALDIVTTNMKQRGYK